MTLAQRDDLVRRWRASGIGAVDVAGDIAECPAGPEVRGPAESGRSKGP